MLLNDLLIGKGIDPREVIILRHAPNEPDLRAAFPLICADRPDLSNAYQQTQTPRLEKAMTGASYVASFIADRGGRAIFIGLYRIGSSKPLSFEQYWRIPAHKELRSLGMVGFTAKARSTVLRFDLTLVDFYSSWKGRLIVDWPPPNIAWWRRADRNSVSVRAILEDSALDDAMKKWDELDLTWAQLAILPKRWKATLSQWRGIYYIFDKSDGKGYVGSAYGENNILGRWLNYAATGHGGNRQLKKRKSQNFHFTILELVSPTMDSGEVVRRENTWKARLHTRKPFGLNDN